MGEKVTHLDDVDAQLLNGERSNSFFGSLTSSTPKRAKTKKPTLISWIHPNISPSIDTYGKIAFKGMTRKSMARFIRLPLSDIEGKLDAIYKLTTKKWDVEKPRLIVSITGGAKNFDIEPEALTNFKDIILKISQTPGAWVISGGTHAGVMKHVGDALREESTAVCLGIATWGVINNREKLIPALDAPGKRIFPYHVGSWLKAKGAYLDPNHTHFLLIDDGKENYGSEIKFRADFERHVTEKYDIPFVLVVLNGGSGTFMAVYETLMNGFPVVLIKGSRRVADLFADIVEDEDQISWTHKELFVQLRKEVENFDEKFEECLKQKHLFSVARKEEKEGMKSAMMKALLSRTLVEGGSMSAFDYLRYALLWHHPDIVRREIPINCPEKFSSERNNGASECSHVTAQRRRISFEQLDHLLIMALARGNMEFTRLLLLEYEMDIHDILTTEVIELLYGYQTHAKNFPSPFAEMIRYDYNDSLHYADSPYVKEIYRYNANWCYQDGECTLSIRGINKLKSIFVRDTEEDPSLQLYSGKVIENPLWELFVWATVCNLPRMAEFLWPFEGDQLSKAMIAYKFWGDLAHDEERYDDKKIDRFRQSEETFKSLAIELLDQCYHRDEKKATKLITTTLYQVPNKTCIELAVDLHHYDFLAHSCVQNVLTDVWTGRMNLREVTDTEYLKMLVAIFLPFLIGFWYKFQPEKDREEDEKCENPTHKHMSLIQGPLTNSTENVQSSTGNEIPRARRYSMREFYSYTPVVAFLIHFVFFLAFLMLYSYVTLHEQVNLPVSDYEILLYVIVFGHFTSEVYQATYYDDATVRKKLRHWVSDKYNRWDAFNMIVFAVAVGLRVNKETWGAGHTLHSINCGFWIIRISTALRVSSTFGQYMEMVRLMLRDLLDFLLILFFVILAYGVLSTSLLYPGDPSYRQFLSIVMRPWFHIYGDNFVEIEAESNTTTYFGTPKRNNYDEYIVWLCLGVYLILTNILLLNIIIAVFNNTYADVKNQGTKIWKFKRYKLVVEYAQRITAPPPLCIIVHVYLLLRWLITKCCRASKCGCCAKAADKEKKWKSMELKRLYSLMNTNEKVELAQFECDCAMLVYRKRTKAQVDAKVEEDANKRKEGRMEEMEKSIDDLKKSMDELMEEKETTGKLDDIRKENEKLKGAAAKLQSTMDGMKCTIEQMHKLLRKQVPPVGKLEGSDARE